MRFGTTWAVMAALSLGIPSSTALLAGVPEANQSPRPMSELPARFDVVALRSLSVGQSIVIADLPVAGGSPIDVRLERFSICPPNTQFVVGRPGGADETLDFNPSSVVLLRGEAIGEPGSHVFVALSDSSVQGYIQRGLAGADLAITSRGLPAASGRDGQAWIVRAESAGGSLPPGVALCGVDTGSGQPSGGGGAGPRGVGTPGRRQVQLAVETDYEYFSLFGNAFDAAAYVVTLYGAVSDIYVRDTDAHITLSFVRIWDMPADLFDDPDPLNPFRDYWNANMGAVVRDTAQFLSGRRDLPAGGVAYLSALCTSNGYSWAGYTLGYFYDPAAPHILNRDIMVTAHELGHTCSALHTHDQGLDTCNDELSQPRRGTIMAYCGQTFTGGDANHDLWFHTVSRADMRSFIQSSPCIAIDCNVNGIPDATDIANSTSLDANSNGVPDECEDCNGNSVLDPADIATATSLDRNANGIPDECEADCNGNGMPDDLDLLPTSGGAVFTDNFQSDLGWTVTNLGATSGNWQRGVPVNDAGWQYDPASDADGSGQCYLTENAAGNTDVDGGATRVTSPLISMAAGNFSLQYDYYLNLTNTNGVDRLLVEGSSNNGTSWATLATHTTNGGTAWRRQVILPGDFAAAGLPQTANMRFRFTANDDNPASIVEAGLDAFKITTATPPVSEDLTNNNIPDECEGDCDNDGTVDYVEIIADMSLDLNRNVVLDSCEDCDNDNLTDLVELNQSHNVWVAGLEQSTLREYFSLYGTQTRISAAGFLQEPQDVIITSDRRILVSSRLNHRVVEFSLNGAFVRDLVIPSATGLLEPGAMAISPAGTLVIASQATSSVIECNLSTGALIRTLVAAGAAGLTAPFGVAYGPGGGLFVSSADNRVLEFDAGSGAFVRTFVSAGSGGLLEPHGLLFVPGTGNLLVCSTDTNQILEYNGATGAFIRVFSQVGTDTVLTFDQPWCMRIGPEGDVYASRAHLHDGEPLPPPGGGEPLHLSNARIYQFDVDSGFFVRSFIMGVDSGILNPTGFDFVPDAGSDCNNNRRPDNCDIAQGASADVNNNGVPDECEEIAACPGDVNGDGNVNLTDLSILLTNFGTSGNVDLSDGDLDNDDDVDLTDLAILLANFGSLCP